MESVYQRISILIASQLRYSHQGRVSPMAFETCESLSRRWIIIILIATIQTIFTYLRRFAKTIFSWWMWSIVFLVKLQRCIGVDKRKWKCLIWTVRRWSRNAQYQVTQLSSINFVHPHPARISGMPTQVMIDNITRTDGKQDNDKNE